MEEDLPPGMRATTGTVAAQVPSLDDIRRGSFGYSGWNGGQQRDMAGSQEHQEGGGEGKGWLRRNSSSQGAASSKSTTQSPLQGSRTTPLETYAAESTEPFLNVEEQTLRDTSKSSSMSTMHRDSVDKETHLYAEAHPVNSSEAIAEGEIKPERPRHQRQVRKRIRRPRVQTDQLSSTLTVMCRRPKFLGQDLQSLVSRVSGSGFLRLPGS